MSFMNNKIIHGIILSVVFFMFLLFTETLKWKEEFGPSEIVNIILAGLTVYAVRLSGKATDSAKISAQASKISVDFIRDQTKIMEQDLENNHYPLLIPIPSKMKMPIISQNIKSLSVESTKFSWSVVNVSHGDAYMVSTWLETDIEILRNNYKCKSSSKYYNLYHDHSYKLIYKEKDKNLRIIETEILKDSGEKSSIKTVITDNRGSSVTAIQKRSDSINVDVPFYIARILVDVIYRNSFLNNVQNTNPEINLFIKYKTRDQLKTEDYAVEKYKMSITNITPGFSYKDVMLNNGLELDYFDVSFSYEYLDKYIINETRK